MPTRRGWEVVLGALGVILLGRILGLVQLYVVGIAGLILLVAAVAWVRLSTVKITASRRLRPNRVPVGERAEVELSLTNTSTRRSPLLEGLDRCGASPLGTRFSVAPLAPGETGRISYQPPTDRRGVFELGPLEVEVRDPFGLAATSAMVASGAVLTVLPRVEAIAPPRLSAGVVAPGAGLRPPFAGSSGDSFYALREYAPGDDLRRVHWASTARRGQLMIRQDDQSVQDRTTVLLDLRAGDPDCFEAAVSAAASVLAAAGATLVRLVDTDGRDSGFGTGSTHASAMLDRLAATTAVPASPASPAGTARVAGTPGAPGATSPTSPASGRSHPSGPARPSGGDPVSRALGLLRAGTGGGTLVLVTSALSLVGRDGTELRRLAGLGPRFAQVLVVAVGTEVGRAVRSTGAIRVIPVTGEVGFATAWHDGLGYTRLAKGTIGRTRPGQGASL